MRPPPGRADIEALLAHEGFVRSLALALVRDPNLADDVAQETWRAAIEHPPGDPSTPRRWLATVVRNFVRRGARSEGRRLRREQEAARPEALPATDEIVAREAARREVVDAVFGLEEPYRTAVVLRYLDGLPPRKIAKRLGVSGGAVRSRLQRALAQLRERLDARNGGDRRAWVLALGRLAMEGTIRHGPLKLVDAVALLPLAKSPAVLVVAAVAVAGAVAWVRSPARGGGSLPSAPNPSGPLVAAAAPPERSVEVPPTQEPPATRRETVPVAVAKPTNAVVRGRCVAEDARQALGGCRVQFSGRPSTGGREAEDEKWKDPEPVTTGPDGRFEFAFEPPATYQFSLDILPPERVPRTGRWGGFKPGEVDDLGDILISRGWPVRGNVVDVEGNPVAGVSVGLNDMPLPIQPGSGANAVRYGRSREDGFFEVEVPVPAGTWPLMLSGFGARPYVLVEPKSATVKQGEGLLDLRVVVRRMRSISGVVVDDDGRPIKGFIVEARYPPDFQHCVPPRLGGGQMASSWTRADGSFDIYARYDDPGPLRLAYGPWRTLVLNPDGRTFEWGESGVRLVYRRRPALDLTVVEAGTGRAVEEFAVKCHLPDANSSAATDARLGGKHQGGRLVIDGVEPGVNHLVVIPKEADLVPTQTIAFEAPEAGPLPPMRVEVERALPFSVRLTGPSGKPMAGSKVELLRPQPENPVRVRADTSVLDHRSKASVWTSEGNLPVLISTAETDERGVAALAGPSGERGHVLRIVGSKHPPIVREDFVVPKEGETAELVSRASTGLRGRVVPEAVRSLGLHLHAGKVGDPASRLMSFFPIGPDGAFEIGDLEAGEWEIRVQVRLPFNNSQGSMGSQVLYGPPLGSFRLEEGEMREVTLAAAHLVPGSLHGTVLAGDSLRRSPKVTLQLRTESFSGAIGEFPLDDEGRFEVEALFPAEYRLFLSFPDGTTLEDDEWFTVGPAEKVVREFRPKPR